jgi:hypothetical protein
VVYKVIGVSDLPHSEIAYIQDQGVIGVLADELNSQDAGIDLPSVVKCGPLPESPSSWSCVIAFNAGAHGSVAIVVKLTDKAVIITDRGSAGVRTP